MSQQRPLSKGQYDAIQIELEAAEASIVTMMRTMAAAQATNNPAALARLMTAYMAEREQLKSRVERLKTEEEMPDTPAEEKTVKRMSLLGLIVLIFVALLLGGSAVAQDEVVTLEPTAFEIVTSVPVEGPVIVSTAEAPVDEAPPIVVIERPPAEQSGFKIGEFLLGLASGAFVALAGVFGLVGRLKNDKTALDAIEWLGKSIPVEALDKLNNLGRTMRDAGEVLDKVTDGQVNVVISPDTAAAIKSTGLMQNVAAQPPIEQFLPLESPPETSSGWKPPGAFR